jgi:ASCH domain
MKALSIRQPHAEAIMRGVKPIEYRSRLTNVRERIYIYASLGRYRAEEEAEMLKMYGMGDVNADDLPRGVLVGTVELWDCTGSGGNYEWHVRKPERAERLLKPKKQPQPSWFNPF